MTISRKIRIPIYLLLALMMPLVVLLSSTLHFAFDTGFFLKAFEADQTAEHLGLDPAGMAQVADTLTGYMAGRLDSMDLAVPIHGEPTRFYNERELAHMVDVRNLMAFGGQVRSVLLFFSLLLLVLLKRFGGVESFWRGLLASSLGALGFAGLLGFLAANDFSGAFYKFHEIFFTNSLWLLDPATDRLIQMLPETFFFSMTTRILFWSGFTVFLMGAVAIWGIRRCKAAAMKVDSHADTL